MFKRIKSITLEEKVDENPDLSYLGEICETKLPKYKPGKYWIPINPNNLNEGWFSPCNHLPFKQENWDHVSTEDQLKVIEEYRSLRKAAIHYAYEDLKRLQAYHQGTWWSIGLILTAHVEMSEDGEHWTHEKIWDALRGIDSDAGEDNKKEIVNDLI